MNGKTYPWFVLLFEYEEYVRFLEAKIEKLEATLDIFKVKDTDNCRKSKKLHL